MRNLSTFINRTVYGLKNRLYGHIAYLLPNWEVLLMVIFAITGCSTVKYVPVETKTVINYVDSLRIKDSTVVIPIERYVDIVPELDTLRLETSLATAVAYADTSLRVLKGKIENKQGVEYRYIYKDRIEYRDSIRTVEKPVPVEVVKSVTPKWAWYSLSVCVFTLIRLLIKLWLKLKI